MRACGRSSAHRPLTVRMTAFERVEESRPCSWNQARSLLDRRQRVQVADAVEQRVRLRVLAALDAVGEGLEDRRRSTCARAASRTWSWHSMKTVERVVAVVDQALSRRASAGDDVHPRASANSASWSSRERRSLVGGRACAAPRRADAADDLARRRALDDRLDHLVGDELHRPERVELAEVVLVVGQQPLGDELQQDRVVALERGEDVGVGLQRGEAVGGQVAGAAAASRHAWIVAVACQVASALMPAACVSSSRRSRSGHSSSPEKQRCRSLTSSSWAKCSA